MRHQDLVSAIAAREALAAKIEPARRSRLGAYRCHFCTTTLGHPIYHVGVLDTARYRKVRLQ